jgi:hypothetical protein
MPRKTRDIEGSLGKKGFKKKDTHHTFFHLWVDDKKTTIHTKISHGSKEVSDPLLGQMAKQVRLNRSQFCDLVDCSLTHDGYLEILREGGHIEPLSDEPATGSN